MILRHSGTLLALPLLLALDVSAMAQTPVGEAKPASAATATKNAEVLKQLPFADRIDFEEAKRGLVAPLRDPVKAADGSPVWDIAAYDFLRAGQSPASVNPSLWRMAQLNANAGLFRVADRIYQLRGFDLSNMTIIEGDSGLIIVDPLTTAESARAALAFYGQHRPKRPVVAVIYTHSHIDHFGGVRGVVDEADVKAGRVQIVAPTGFLEEAVSENVLAGSAMLRRAQYQAGSPVARGVLGHVDSGLGKSGLGAGATTLIAPTVLVTKAYETRRIDGVDFEFQLTAGTEAPAGMNLYLPAMRALGVGDNVTHAMHNILTPRGAPVRDAEAWSKAIDDSLVHYGDRTDVMFGQHSWPSWGGERVRTILADQRDMYGWLHDRALHLLNQGLTPAEIADAMTALPGDLAKKWYLRGNYGTIGFNARAVYQRYLGFYDGNPSSLDPLTPADAGRRYIAAMGGSARVLEIMRKAIAAGDYRWATEIGNRLVFAEPDNAEARGLQADALEQLGYQSESALYRNMYLSGATELRSGVNRRRARNAGDLVRALEPSMYFDLLTVRLDSDRAQGHDMTLNWIFTDPDRPFALTLRNGVLTYREGMRHDRPDATIFMDKQTLDRLNLREIDLKGAIAQGAIRIEGDEGKMQDFMGMLVTFDPSFAIVTP